MHVIFDLDRTLWDMDTNSKETLNELFLEIVRPLNSILSFDDYFTKYTQINNKLWEDYRNGLINQQDLRYGRFRKVFTALQINNATNKHIQTLNNEYVARGPLKKVLLEGAIDVLDYCKDKGYTLHILSNGFKEVQLIKLRNSGIYKYFNLIITSEDVGVSKPNEKIFNCLLKWANTQANNCIMVGDDFDIDCKGASNVGIKSFWLNSNLDYNRNNIISIKKLSALKNYI